MKNLKKLFGALFLAVSITACTKDEEVVSEKKGLVLLNAKATFNKAGRFQEKANSISVTSFLVNLKEIEFEFDDNNDDNDDDATSDFGFDDDVKLIGPFELNLLNNPVSITTAELPKGVYEEIEFKLDKNENSSSPMFNKSIEIKGTINGKPFVYWDNEDEEFEVDYEDKNVNISIENNNLNLNLNFDLNKVFSNTNLTSAKDGDGDGVIEIGPNDQDGNSNIADDIDDKLEEFADLD